MKTSKCFVLFLACVLTICLGCQNAGKENEGLVGIYFSEPNLTSIKGISVLTSLDQVWGENHEHGIRSSGKWEGCIIAPTDGGIRFRVQSDQKLVFKIEGFGEVQADAEEPEAVLTAGMRAGEAYPVALTFWNESSEDVSFSIKWSWEGHPLSSIPSMYLSHTKEQMTRLDWIKEPDPEAIDMSQFIRVPARHVVVFHEKGRFGGWPANNGIWSWGDEILVGFIDGHFLLKKHHHSIHKAKPSRFVLARSLDGGESWTVEDPEHFVGDGGKPVRLKHRIDFSHPDFTLRSERDRFFYSYDRGKSWKGPYFYPELNVGQLTSRTDYLTQGQDDCFFFLSCKSESVQATLQDRAFCARTTDGGKTLQFLGWMAQTDTIRSVMPSTVRVSDTHLISALRRRYDPPMTHKLALAENWISVHESLDNGKTWSFLNRIANTDTGLRNGNPPSMVRLANGRICVMYGYRGVPYTIRARISDDDGKTWSKEIILRDGARNWDIGYTRSVVRPDQKVVTVYYFTSDDPFENHIAATIWNPMEVEI